MSLLSGQQQSRAAVLPSRSHRPRCGVPRSALADPADVAADAVARAVTLARRATEEEEAEEAGPPGDGDGDGTPPASPSLSLAEAVPSLSLAEAVAKRRCWAIISHPDAGKTTLTEKLLLYGGAIHEAGEVRARRGAKSATSDWMAIEKERGISSECGGRGAGLRLWDLLAWLRSAAAVGAAADQGLYRSRRSCFQQLTCSFAPLLTRVSPPVSSTAMSFNYGGFCLNLLDTPGHADFSEVRPCTWRSWLA